LPTVDIGQKLTGNLPKDNNYCLDVSGGGMIKLAQSGDVFQMRGGKGGGSGLPVTDVAGKI